MLFDMMHFELLLSLVISGVAGLWLTLINKKRQRWFKRYQPVLTVELSNYWHTAASGMGYLIAFSPAAWFTSQLAWAGLLMWLAGIFIIGWIIVEVLSPHVD